MKSKKKIAKRTSAIFGLAAVPTAAALGLAYGIIDDKIDLRLSPANDFGERYFDDKIVKVNDDEFASGILYDPIERSNDYSKFNEENQKDGDISGLVRLDRKIDAKYTRSLVNIDESDTSQGKISVEGGLVYDFKGIKQLVTTKSGKKIFGKDLIKGMEEDAKSAITKAIYDFKVKNNSDSNDNIDRTQPLRMGIYFEKNVIERTVSIYLYELKDFDPEQDKVIHNFISKVESHKVDQGDDWIKTFRYNVWNYPSAPMSDASEADSYDRIDGLDNMVEVPDIKDNLKLKKAPTGFPEIFAGQNLMTIGVANNWYQLGGIADKDQVGVSIEKDGKIGIVDYKFSAYEDFDKFKQIYPEVKTFNGVSIPADEIIDRIKNSKYISENGSENKPMMNFLESSTHGHEIGPIQFAEKGIVPFIQPIVDYKNKVLKLKYTFKAFRKLGSDTTRSVGTFNMGDEVENPYEICTYIKEIPLEKMGNEGKYGNRARIKISDVTGKKFQPFYVDDTTNIDPKDPEYNSLKASVVNAMKGKDGKHHSDSQVRIDNSEEINTASAKRVLKEFLATKTPAFSEIPIVGPGMGILGQMIPAIAASVQSWMDIGTMTAADPTISNIYTPELMDKLIENINNDPIINPTEFINSINSFTKEAWSDLNSLINLSGKVLNGERTSRTFQLFHLLAAFNDISQPIFDAIKKNNPDAYMGNNTSVIDQLMSWLKKNGIINSSDSLMDIIDNYKERLGTIVETLGINRPTMLPDLVQQLVDLVPLPLFSQEGSQFNRDTAAVLEALLNGKYIKPNSDDKNEERILPAIIALLNGGQRTSVQTFFEHILNDKPADLMKFVLGVIGADFSSGDTFAEAIKAIWTMFEAKVPDYDLNPDGSIKMEDKKDSDNNVVTTLAGIPVQVPVVKKDAAGNPKMIMNPTFGGIGVALEKMYTGGIHSVPKESYDSIIKFIFGTVGSMVDMGTLTLQEEKDTSEGLFDFVTNGARAKPDSIKAIINLVNKIMNKEVISTDMSALIEAVMNAGAQGIKQETLKPLITKIRPTLIKYLKFDSKLTDDRISEIFVRIFNGFSDSNQLKDDMSDLIPVLATTDIPGGKAIDLLVNIFNKKGYKFPVNMVSPQLDKISVLFHKGIAHLSDSDWSNTISAAKSLITTINGFAKGTIPENIKDIVNDVHAVLALQGIGHLLSNGLAKTDYSDLSNIMYFINSMNLGFAIPEELIHPLAFLIQNIAQNGIDLSTLDIDTIIKIAEHFGGGSLDNIIKTINAGNPEQEINPPEYNKDAFSKLLIDFVIGHKYEGKPGDYARDKIGAVTLPTMKTLLYDKDGKLLTDMPPRSISIANPDKTSDQQTIYIDNPNWWDQNDIARLTNKFNDLKLEITTGRKGGDPRGRVLTESELFNKLIEAQGIPTLLANINEKIDKANAGVQIYIDAMTSFGISIKAIEGVPDVQMASTLQGDDKDNFKAIKDLFTLLKTKIAEEARAKSIGGFRTSKVQKWQIDEYVAKYSHARSYLEELNGLMEDLNKGSTGNQVIDGMKDVFGRIASEYRAEGIKGVLPGLPAELKTMLDDFLASTSVGSDSDGNAVEVSHQEGGLWGFGSHKVVDKPKKASTAQASFIKFISENWHKLFDDQSGSMKGASGWDIVNHFQSGIDDWKRNFGSPFAQGHGASIDAKGLANEMLMQIKDETDKKIFKQLIDEFMKHTS